MHCGFQTLIFCVLFTQILRLLHRSSLEEGTIVIMSDVDAFPHLERSPFYGVAWHHCRCTSSCKVMCSPSNSHLLLFRGVPKFMLGSLALPSTIMESPQSGFFSDSGWHCSFCFRRIQDFRFKMMSYSHSDRLYGNRRWKNLLDPRRIQEKICNGEDLFDMLPEAYTWSDLFDGGQEKSGQQAWRICRRPYCKMHESLLFCCLVAAKREKCDVYSK